MANNDMQALRASSYLEADNAEFLESLYNTYLSNPSDLSSHWQDYFRELGPGQKADENLDDIRAYFKQQAQAPRKSTVAAQPASVEHEIKEFRVAELINAYRTYGHHEAKLDPLELTERPPAKALELSYHGLSDVDLNTTFHAGRMIGKPNVSLQAIIDSLKKTYCENIGVEYTHITNTAEIEWLQEKMESVENHPNFSSEIKRRILDSLTHAEGLEQYLGTKFVGQKRFSLEGGDSLIPLLDSLIYRGANLNVDEFVLGMAHRGRLNVLVNIIGKSPKDLLAEFEGKLFDTTGSGDVKYHKGFSSDISVDGKIMHLALAFNPSHLEIVNPVVEGSVRARQRRRKDVKREMIVPIIIHGDAAISGQGVVMETFNFSQARGFTTGGSINITINNQVGFTTSNPLDSRSTLYCTDIAKMIQAPVFHVNGNNPEAVAFVAELAMEYRQQFKKDVMIDLVCYRTHGHNEADDPSITQPEMYQVVKTLKTPRQLYADQLIASNVIDKSLPKQLVNDYMDRLDAGQDVIDVVSANTAGKHSADWTPHIGQKLKNQVETKLPKKTLVNLAKRLTETPESFSVHPQVQRLLKDRNKMTAGEVPMNWGYAETLAYASLVNEGYPIRLCGQDSGRGTFSHRHAELHDCKNGDVYTPLSHLTKDQAPFIVIDSILSEAAVLAFEYGFSTAYPEALTIWEAQFGDFANGAQVVIDQFISSGEQKWNRYSGLMMLLPHGYEGMGPEHSSARLERYLQLCAQQNIQVCVPSTPAQIFHLIRRQMKQLARKPCIVMSPKSLLRHKLAASTFDDLTKNNFQVVIPEMDDLNDKEVKRVVICSGKVYYDLLQKRRDNKRTDVAIIRVEQLYPFPRKELTEALKAYTQLSDVVWCQEEPKNQGAWYQIYHHLSNSIESNQTLHYEGRSASAAPACGYAHQHAEEQIELVIKALG